MTSKTTKNYLIEISKQALKKCWNLLRARLRKHIMEEHWLRDYVAMGMKVGSDSKIMSGLVVDHSHCWLIEIGDNVRKNIRFGDGSTMRKNRK